MANPYNSNTLDSAAPSPPPHGNFAVLPRVYRGPYEYGAMPGRGDVDFWPQWEPPPGGDLGPAPTLQHGIDHIEPKTGTSGGGGH